MLIVIEVFRMNKILLIEDDYAIAQQIKLHFQRWGLVVIVVKDFKGVMEVFNEINPSLVIIDIQLPFYDGFHWCREIRLHSQVPILFLSSRDQPLDMIMAMQIGADDYIQKPFNMEVLLSKVQALLRRTYEYSSPQEQLMNWNGAIIDYKSSVIRYQGMEQELTKNEQYILKALLAQRNKIVTRDELMRKLWDDERFVNDNTLTVNVNRLRASLNEIGMGDFIETKKGLGYMAKSKDELND